MAKITTQLDFNIDKSGLNDLNKSLDAVIRKAEDLQQVAEGYADPLLQAADAAKDFKTILNSAFNPKMNKLDLSKVNNDIKDLYGTTSNFQEILGYAGTEGSKAFDKISSSILSFQAPLKQSSQLMDKMAITMKNTIRFGISSAVFNEMANSIGRAYNFSVKLDESLNNIRIVSGESAANMERFAQQANAAAQNLGTTTLDYTNAALIYYQQGLSDEEVAARTETTIKLANVAGESSKEISDYMTAIWNNFYDGSKSLEYYADALAKLGAETASSSAEIAEGLEKFASISETIGLSYEYAAAALTTVTAETRQSADIVGTAFKTLFARMQDLELGDEGAVSIGKYSQAMEEFGIHILDASGNLRSMDEILAEMGSKWQTLSEQEQVALAQAVGGTRQYTQLISLMDNWDEMEKNLQRIGDSTGTLNKQQATYAESTTAHLKELQATWEHFYQSIFKTDVINVFIDAIQKAVKVLNSFVSGLGGGGSTLLYVGAALVGLFGTQLGGALQRLQANMLSAKQSAEALTIQMDLLNSYKNNANIISSENEALKEKLELLEKVFKSREAYDEKEYQDIILKINALEQERQKLIELQETRDEYQKYIDDYNTNNPEDKIRKNSPTARKKYVEYAQEQIATNEQEISDSKTLNLMLKNKEFETVGQANALFDLEKLSDILYEQEHQAEEMIYTYEQEQAKILEIQKELSMNKDLTIETKTEKENELEILQREAITEHQYNIASEQQREAFEQLIAIQDIMENNDQNRLLTEEELTALQQGNFLALEQSMKAKEKYSKIDEKMLTNIDATIKMRRQEVDLQKENVESITEANKKQIEYQNRLSLISSISTTLISSSGIWETIFNPDIGAWDKFTNTLSVVIVQAGILHKLFDDASSPLGQLNSEWNSLSSNGAKLSALFKSLTTAVLGEAAAEKLAAQMKKLGNKETYASIAAKLKEIAVTSALKLKNMALAISVAYETAMEKTNNVAIALGNVLKTIAIVLIKGVKAAWESLMASSPLIVLYAILAAITLIVKGIQALGNAIDESLANKAKNAAAEAKANAEEAKKLTDQLNEEAQAYRDLIPKVQELSESYNDGAISIKNYRKEVALLLDTLGNKDLAAKILNGEIAAENIEDAINKEAAEKDQEVIDSILGENGTIKQQENALSQNILSAINNSDTYSHSRDDKRNGRETIDLEGMVARNDSENALAGELADLGIEFDDSDHIYIDTLGQVLQKNSDEVMKVLDKYAGTKAAAQLKSYIEDSGVQSLIEESKDTNAKLEEARQDRIGKLTIKSNGQYKKIEAGQSADDETLDMKTINSANSYDEAVQSLVNASLTAKGYTEDFKNQSDENKKIVEDYIKDTEQWAKEYLNAYGENIQHYAQESILAEDIKNALGEALSPEAQEKLFSDDAVYKLDYQQLLGLSQVDEEDLKSQFINLYEDLMQDGVSAAEAESSALQLLGDQYRDTSVAAWTLDNSIEKQLEDLDITQEEFSEYVDQLMDGHEELKENAELTQKVALYNTKMNKGLSDLAEHVEDYSKILKENNRNSDEFAKTLEAMQQIMGNVLNIDGSKLSDDFYTNAQNIKLMEEAAEGSTDAVEQLRAAAGDDIITQYIVNADTDKAKEALNDLDSYMDELTSGLDDITLTADFESSGALEKINEFAEKTHKSAKEIQDYFNAIGYDAEVEQTEGYQDVEHTGSYPYGIDENGNVQHKEYTWIEHQQIKIPKIKSLTYNGPAGKTVNFSNTKAGKDTKKSGGGSSNKPQNNKSNDLADRYQEVNEKLEETSHLLKQLSSQEKKLFGADLIKNIDKQLQGLNQEIELTKQKLQIAKGEQAEYEAELKNFGIQFNNDGTINQQSYESIFKREQDRYTSATTDDEAAKERWDKFLKAISGYDKLINDINGLEENIQSDLDNEIELRLQKFTYELELRLDIEDATKKFNEFKKLIIDNFDDDDILGAAQEAFNNLSEAYFGSGVVDELIEKIKIELEELNNPLIYGDDKQSLIENLSEHVEDLEDQLIEIKELEEEIKQDYADMLSQIADEMDETVSYYEHISDLLDHDLKVIQLLDGEEAYQKMGETYGQQIENLNEKVEFQAAQVEFWKKQMEELEAEGRKDTEAWENARDSWISATKDWQATIEESIEKIQEKYVNAIKAVFQEINNQYSNGKGINYIDQQWNLINNSADDYLDTLNAAYGIQELDNKYLEAIEGYTGKSASAQKKLNAIREQEVEILRQKDRLSQYDLDRANLKYEMALKQIALEEAQQAKTNLRLRRDSQGNYTYQYAADEDQITKIKNELSDLYNQLYNLDKGQYSDNLQAIYDTWQEYQEAMIDAAYASEEERLMIQKEYQDKLSNLTEDNLAIRQALEESALAEMIDLYNQNEDNYQTMTEEQQKAIDNLINNEIELTHGAFDTIFGDYELNVTNTNEMVGSINRLWTSGLQEMVTNMIEATGGIKAVMGQAYIDLSDLLTAYEGDLDTLETKAKTNFDNIAADTQPLITATQQLIEKTDTLISHYDDEAKSVKDVWDKLDSLEKKYKSLIETAKEYVTQGYKQLQMEKELAAQAASEGEKNLGKETEQQKNIQPDTTPTPVVTPEPTKPSLTKGSYVEVKAGTRWYADSYGGGAWGMARSGTIKYTSNNPYGYNIDGLGWIRKSDIVGYRSGGYTGDWSDDNGRLAVLHQKELILNSQDTENILRAVETLRYMSSSILGGITSMSGIVGGNGLAQNVHIDASFPNVTNHNEIEEALTNLVNAASQRITT